MKPKLKKEERDYLDRCKSIAVLGGTFDPIHNGHLAIAQAVHEEIKPQRVLFVPCGQPGHKQSQRVSHAKHRYHMTALAMCEHPAFDITQIELNRPGISYTIDTARALAAHCPEGAEISFIIGTDALEGILKWKDADELLKTCSFIVVPRPGHDSDKAKLLIDSLAQSHGTTFKWVDAPQLDISSTEVRRRFDIGQPVDGLIPKWVEDYALCHGLYRTPFNIWAPAVREARFEEAKDKLRVRLSTSRFTHTIGVIEEAERLATHYEVNVEKARWAALLHDAAKEYSSHKKRALCKLWRIELDEVLAVNIDLTHGLLGAESARRDFMIDDEAILQAIRYHTTGHKNMTLLDKIIMLADYTEPYRANWGPIKEMRELSLTNINQALILGTKATIQEAKDNKEPIHEWSYHALKQLKKGR